MNAPLDDGSFRRTGHIPEPSAQDVALVPRSKKRWIAIAALAVAAVGGIAWMLAHTGGSQRSIAAERLRIADATRGPFVSDLSTQGKVVAAVSPTLYAPALGTVTLRVAAGESVKKDQPLAEIVSPEITNELAREHANLEGLRATYDRERLEVETSRLQYRQTVELAKVAEEAGQRELKRATEAHGYGVMPQQEVDRRSDELRIAQVKYAQSQDELKLRNESLDFQLRSRLLEVDRQKLVVENLERRADELHVRAPVDGVVGTLNVAQRAAVAANQPLMTVVDLTKLEIEIQVPETYADSLGLKMPAQVSVAGRTIHGHLTAISPEVNNNTVTARVAFDDAIPPELRQNQRLSVRILLDDRADVVQVPRGSFVDTGGGRFAYVVRDGIAVRTPITIGAVAIDRVEITSGLAPGDRVIVSGDDLFDGAPSARLR